MIHWITESLATASYYELGDPQDSVEAVVIDVRELVDRDGNPPELIREKVSMARQLLKQQKKVILCCDMGLSRSNLVALGVLMDSGVAYQDALDLIQKKTGTTSINLAMLHEVQALFQPLFSARQSSRKNVLITGAGGFVGRALGKRLATEYTLFCPARDRLDLNAGQIPLDTYVSEHQVDLIVHLAQPRPRSNSGSMGEALSHLKNILEVCRLHKIGLLYLSCLTVFSGHATDKIIKADASLPPWPRDTYGETKFLCEDLIRLYGKTWGLKTYIVRAAMVYGKGLPKAALVPKFYSQAIKGETILTHQYLNGRPTFDFLYIEDLVDAIYGVLRREVPVTLNIGTGLGFSTFDLAQKIVRLTNSRSSVATIQINDRAPKVIVDPADAEEYMGWKAKTGLEAGLTEIFRNPVGDDGA